MNIGIDAHVISGKFQGSRTYILNLFKNLTSFKDENLKFYFFGHWNSSNRIFGEESVYINYKSESKIKRLTYQSYGICKKNKIDLLQSQYISPLFLPCDSIVTVHDILFEEYPQYFTNREVLRNRVLVKHSAKHAKQVHTVSEYTKNELIRLYKIDSNKIKVIPNGVDLTRFNNRDVKIAKAKIFNKYGVKDYLLSVGRIEPRKNHLGLVKAYSELLRKIPMLGPLVIVGKSDFGYEQFYDEIKKLGLGDKVIIIDDVDDVYLPLIYKAAILFVYPSFAEGFGIPPLEAMASGLPVITSNTTAIPEVVDKAGILINPNSIDELVQAIKETVTNRELRNRLGIMARKQSEHWSWKNTAELYKDAVSQIYNKQ